MKWIKTFRVFESEELNLFDLLDLGIILPSEVPQVAKGPREIAELILALVERSIEEGRGIDGMYAYLEKLGIESNSLRSEIIKDFGLLVAPEMTRLTHLLFDKYSELEQVESGDQLYWIDSERRPVLRQFIGDSDVFVSYYRIWNLFSNVFGLNTFKTQDIIRKWLSSAYGLEGVRPTADLHSSGQPIE